MILHSFYYSLLEMETLILPGINTARCLWRAVDSVNYQRLSNITVCIYLCICIYSFWVINSLFSISMVEYRLEMIIRVSIFRKRQTCWDCKCRHLQVTSICLPSGAQRFFWWYKSWMELWSQYSPCAWFWKVHSMFQGTLNHICYVTHIFKQVGHHILKWLIIFNNYWARKIKLRKTTTVWKRIEVSKKVNNINFPDCLMGNKYMYGYIRLGCGCGCVLP